MQKHFQSPSDMSLTATVVGAGFSGLTLSYFLHKNGYKVTLLEKSPQVAGILQSPKTEFGVVEHAANGLINSQELIDLCSDINIDILYPSASSKKKLLVSKGKITRWPFGFLETIKIVFKIFKFKKNKMKFKPVDGESFKSWAERVFSAKLLSRLVEPAFQGVYASFSNNLSAVLVTKNLFKNNSDKKRSDIKRQTVCFSGGMQEFCTKLSEYLINNGVDIQLNTKVSKLDFKTLNIITCSAKVASKLLSSTHLNISEDLKKIKYISIAKVSCFVKLEEHSPEGFGCLFPKSEGYNSLGVLFDSSIFPARYEEHSLHTWILGDELLRKCENDEQIISMVKADIKKLWNKELNLTHIDVKLWKETLPLYNKNLEDFIVKYDLESEVANNLYLFGNYTGDLGLSQILGKAKKIATRINYEQTK